MAIAVVSTREKVRNTSFLKVIYSETEPSRAYIWGHPNGSFYIWREDKWVKIRPSDRIEMMEPRHHGVPEFYASKKYVTNDSFNEKFERFKKDVLATMSRQGNGCCKSDELKDYIDEQIEIVNNSIASLQETDANTFNSLEQLNEVDSVTNNRLDALEADDHSDCVTAEEIVKVII